MEKNLAFYSTLSPQDRREVALEMASEAFEDRERILAVANAILDKLTPLKGQEVADIGAMRLAEVLTEMLSDCGQQYRLIDCLKAMQAEYA